jgi:hypothetical protein
VDAWAGWVGVLREAAIGAVIGVVIGTTGAVVVVLAVHTVRRALG